jgi:hypothetical protein
MLAMDRARSVMAAVTCSIVIGEEVTGGGSS